MAYTPSNLTILDWASPISISGTDPIKNLDESINSIVDTDINSVKNHINREMAKVPPYMTNEFNKVYTGVEANAIIAQDSATTATTSATTATTQANTATTKAAEALASANASEASRQVSDANKTATNADVVLTHADAANTNADVVITNADAATTTTQAGIATTKASEASTSASNALTSENNAKLSETNAAISAGSVDANNIIHTIGSGLPNEGYTKVEADATLAQIQGNNTQRFKVADAVNADESLAKGQLLTEMKLVDGAGSGLDADLLDGLDSTQFSKVVSLPNNSGVIKWEKIAYLRGGGASSGGEISFDIYSSGDFGATGRQTLHVDAQQRGDNGIQINVYSLENGNVASPTVDIGYVQVGTYDFDIYIRREQYNPCTIVGHDSTFNGTFITEPVSLTTEPSNIVYVNKNRIWHTGNDGSGSGLDADLVRGYTPTTLPAGIGVGQTWQNVTASRSAGVTYTNTTGKPIMVFLGTGETRSSTYGLDSWAVIYVDNIIVASATNNNSHVTSGVPVSSAQTIVPPGSTYKFSWEVGYDDGILLITELR